MAGINAPEALAGWMVRAILAREYRPSTAKVARRIIGALAMLGPVRDPAQLRTSEDGTRMLDSAKAAIALLDDICGSCDGSGCRGCKGSGMRGR